MAKPGIFLSVSSDQNDNREKVRAPPINHPTNFKYY
jgi:hypothetical protein